MSIVRPHRIAAIVAALLGCAALLAHAPDADGKQRAPRKAAAKQRAKDSKSQDVEDIDRVVVRWHSRATGGVKKPQFITARELAFEARIEALTESDELDTPYTDKHVRSAMQRHIAEAMLARLPVDPKPSPKKVAKYAEAARKILVQRIGAHAQQRGEDDWRTKGAEKLKDAREAEKITPDELRALLRRRARASWYLDKMVAPMLRATELDLREVHKRGETPFSNQRFEDVRVELHQWYISTRLADALDRYFRNARSRVKVKVIGRPWAKRKQRRQRRK